MRTPLRTTAHWVSLITVVVASVGSWSTMPAPDVEAQTGTVFASETGLYVETVQVKDGTVYYGGTTCGSELVNPRTFLRAQAASTGPIRSLHESGAGQPCASSNYALDDQYVYWTTGAGQLVRVSRGAGSNPAPTPLTTTVPISTSLGYDLQVTATHFAWLELNYNAGTSRLVRAPKAGGPAETLPLAGWANDLAVDAVGALYFLRAGTLTRAVAQGSSFATTTIGTPSKTGTFTLSADSVYWIEATTTANQYRMLRAPLTAPSSVTPLSTFNRPASVAPLSLIHDSRNLYWSEAALTPTGGRTFFRLPFAGGTPVLVGDTPTGYAEIDTDGQFLYYTDTTTPQITGRVRRVPVDAIGVDLASPLATIEVVQAIQGPTNDVPLVADKSTLVRVYVQAQNTLSGQALAVAPLVELHGARSGQPLPGSPLTPIRQSDGVNNAALDRRTEANSALFRLPANWTSAGTIDLRAELNPVRSLVEANYGNNSVSTSVTFQPVPRPCLFMVPVQTVSGTLTGPSPVFTPHFDRAESLWPVDRFNPTFLAGPARRRPRIPFGIGGSDPYNLNSDFELGYLLWNLWWSENFGTGFACNGAGSTTVAAVPNASRFGMAGDGVLTYLQIAGGSSGAWSMPQGGTAGLAHELGHAWGRPHVDCGGAGFPGFYPYPPCQLDGTDGPLSHVGFDPLTLSVISPTASADYMSYGDPIWTSDFTYKALFTTLRGGSLVTAADQPLALTEAVLVSGLIGDSPQIGYAVTVSGSTLTTLTAQIAAAAQPSAQYRLVGVDAAGTTVYNQPLQVQPIETEGATSAAIFAHLVPTVPQAVRYVVQTTAGATVVQRQAGSNPPVVAVLSPVGGVLSGATLEIVWSASDPDGDPLMSTVRYSPDNGASWIVIGDQTTDRRLTVPIDAALPGGTQARVQVITSDGIHSTAATSAPFEVPQRAPQVAILDSGYRQLGTAQPGGGQQSEGLALSAHAYDAEDGTLTGTSLNWALTGPETRSASGERVHWEDLTPGAYQVTLTATDSAGVTSQATAPYTISPKRIFDAAAPALDGVCNDAGYAEDRDPIRLRFTPSTGLPNAHTGQVRLVRSGDFLYACFVGLGWGLQPDGFAALTVNVEPTPGSVLGPTDRGFFIRKDGSFFTGTGPNNSGTGFTIDAEPRGLTASVSRNGDFWSAEMRIALTEIGGWGRVVRLDAGQYWRDYVGDDTLWPRASGYNRPNTWGLVALGSLNQSITFGPLADQRQDAATFILSATASSGLPVAYTATGACEVVGNALSVRGLGTCVVQASQPGNAAYSAAPPVTRTFRIQTVLFLPTVQRQP